MSAIFSDFFADLTRRYFGADIYSAQVCANCEGDLIRFCFVSYETNAPVCLTCIATHYYTLTPVELVALIKQSIGCEVCGYSTSNYALHLDHLNRSLKYRTKSGKVVEPSDLIRNCSISVCVRELANVQILCANHHAEKTEAERASK